MDRHATSEETASFKRRMKRKAGRILVLEARALEKREQVGGLLKDLQWVKYSRHRQPTRSVEQGRVGSG